MADDPVVDVRDLSFAYAGRAALEGVTIAAAAGSVTAILGPNGSGKTTLFRLLSTLLASPPGAIRIGGSDPAIDPSAVRRAIGVVFQSPSLDRHLTAAENLAVHAKLYGLGRSGAAARSAELLSRLDAGGLADRRIDALSGGERRRVEIAKALLPGPRVLLLDEPSTGLDPSARRALADVLAACAAAGTAVLLTTHLMDEAEHCDRVVVMHRGRVVGSGPPAELRQQVRGEVLTVRGTDLERLGERIRSEWGAEPLIGDGLLRVEVRDAAGRVPQVVAWAGEGIASIAVSQPTLEDVFFHLTGSVPAMEPAAAG